MHINSVETPFTMSSPLLSVQRLSRLATRLCLPSRPLTSFSIDHLVRNTSARPRGVVSCGIELRLERRRFSTDENIERPAPIRNEALKQIKALGMTHLESTTDEVAAKTRDPLFTPENEIGPSPDQLAEANRVYSVITDVLENLSGRDSTFSIRGEPIVIMEVEVSKDLKQARIYWSLPFSVHKFPDNILDEVTRRMQEILQTHGGKIQRLVHARLCAYYPPKLRFVPSEDNIFRRQMQDMARRKKR